MKEKGAQTRRLGQNYKDVLPSLLNMAEKPRMTLEIQQELSDGMALEETMAGLFINSENEDLQKEQEEKTAKLQADFAKQLEEQQAKLDAARHEKRQKLIRKEQEDLKMMEKKQQLMNQQLELYRLNQRVKQAEIAARLREEEVLEPREREREREEQRLRQRREAQERESRQRARLSLTQRKHVDQQLDLLRAASAGEVAEINVSEVGKEGVGMVDEGGDTLSVTRSGLNQWCDFCLKPYGLGQWVREYDPVPSPRRWVQDFFT